MHLYFLLIRIAAVLGHLKARALAEANRRWLRGEWDDSLRRAQGAIWIHAASVGEFEQARPLIEKLKNSHLEQKIVVSFFSPSGYEMRKDYDQADGIYYLPFATRRNAVRWLDRLQPGMAIFVKYEFWPAYLRELKRRNIPTYSICTIFRPGQLFFRPWGKRHLSLLHCFTHLFVQDESSLMLLQSHGIEACSVAGDTRFDRMAEVRRQQSAASARLAKHMAPIERFAAGGSRVIVAGSTWPGDERLLAEYIRRQTEETGEQTRLIVVPHEIDEEHMAYIFNLFQGRIARYSVMDRWSQTGGPGPHVLVVDTMGLLSQIYRLGQVAYIGGGFGVGIHNTIEAAAYGMPVVFGPNYQHFREAKGLIAAGAARSIATADELTDALDTALAQHEQIGAKAAAYVASELGATEKIYKEIFNS